MSNPLSPRQLVIVAISRFFGKTDDIIAESMEVDEADVASAHECQHYVDIEKQVFSMMTAMIVQSQVYFQPPRPTEEDVLKNMDPEQNKV